MQKPTIIFSGMMAADPGQGGATWAVLQYVLGLRELGCDVCFVEPIAVKSLHPAGITLNQSANATYFRSVVDEFQLQGRAALLLAGTRETCGMDYEELLSFAARADLLINISGMLTDPALIDHIPVRAYLDLDPAFNQWWHSQGIDMRFAAHNRFITIGQCLGESECPVPTCGLDWIRTFQPIVLSHWPVAERLECDAFTTIGNWRSYGSVEVDGVFYGQKAHSLRNLIGLPRKTKERLMLAMTIYPEEVNDLIALGKKGWQLLDPARVSATPAMYRDFIGGSLAELGVAKSGYVLSRGGWFSDRSVCYLASGRPVLAQETGFSRHLPTGRGLRAFNDADDAVPAIEDIRGNYESHRRAARELAEEYFDSRKVLRRLLDVLGVGI
jgi:hypothetical protein